MSDHYATTPARRKFLKELLKAMPGNSGRVQCIRLLEALRHGPITTNEARRFLDIFDPASRVRDLRHRFGFEISTNWWESDTERGVRHRVGQYHLMSERGASVKKHRITPDPTNAKPSKPVPSASRADDIELVQQSEPRVSTQVLATHLGTKHRSAMALLDKHREAFERIGQVTFEMSNGSRAQGGGRAERIGLLTEDQAYLLLAMGRNTDKVVDLKVRLVQAFSQARKAAADRLSHQAEPGWRGARIDTKRGHHLIGFAVKTSRLLAGKEIKSFHYSNEARLVANAMLGTTQDHLCRDCMGREELRVLAKVEQLNAELIAMGESYAVRKGKVRLYALQLLADLQRRGCVLLHANPTAMLEGLI